MAELATAIGYVFFTIFLFYIGVCSGRSVTNRALTPVVIVPGHGGNQMEMKVDRKEPVLPRCSTSTNGWIHTWLNLWHFLPGNLECWIEHNKMSYDVETGEYHNTEGVEFRVPGWGQVDTIEYLDPSIAAFVLGNVGSYLAPMIHKLQDWGYEPGVNVRGAPYDFRYSPASIQDFHGPLKDLIEETYTQNGNARVALVSHSMGGLMSYYFLNQQTPEWKKKYIHSMTTMNTPWKGLAPTIEAVVSGYTWGHNGIDPNTFRTMQRSCESGVFLMPSPSVWGADHVLVQTSTKNYTSSDFEQLFNDIDFPVGYLMWNRIKDEMIKLKNPGVDTWCFYSSGKPTPKSLVYDEGTFPDGPPHHIMGDGDGTSNLESASACNQWKDTFDNLVVTKEFENLSHNGILSSSKMYSALKEIIVS